MIDQILQMQIVQMEERLDPMFSGYAVFMLMSVCGLYLEQQCTLCFARL